MRLISLYKVYQISVASANQDKKKIASNPFEHSLETKNKERKRKVSSHIITNNSCCSALHECHKYYDILINRKMKEN